jgi:tRNA threonylcarbamoyladenosine biosynthesis protein TsaE
MKPPVVVFSPSSTFTKRVGVAYGQCVAAAVRKRPAIIFLQGDLGSGKTTFVKGFLKAFGVVPRGASPTFVLMKHYRVARRRGNAVTHLYHYDAYRLASAHDFEALGFRDAVADPRAIILIEWPEKISTPALRPTQRIRFSYGALPNERLLSFS